MKKLLVAAGLSLVTAPVFALECEEGMRAFIHLPGETSIPEDPRRIVATRQDNLATPLIELGGPLVDVGVDYDANTGEAIIRPTAPTVVRVTAGQRL